jgi:hypothetical protein
VKYCVTATGLVLKVAVNSVQNSTERPEPYFDDSLPEEYIEGVIYRRSKRAVR